jgi:hypothetical protein
MHFEVKNHVIFNVPSVGFKSDGTDLLVSEVTGLISLSPKLRDRSFCIRSDGTDPFVSEVTGLIFLSQK